MPELKVSPVVDPSVRVPRETESDSESALLPAEASATEMAFAPENVKGVFSAMASLAAL